MDSCYICDSVRNIVIVVYRDSLQVSAICTDAGGADE